MRRGGGDRRRLGFRLRAAAIAAVRWWAMVIAVVAVATAARAGESTRDELAARFAPPFSLGERDAKLPVWPVVKSEGGKDRLVAYIFESADIAPIPGFSGTPPNLLVVLGVDGEFQRVAVISQHEPVFVDGLGTEPLEQFVRQYAGKTLAQNVKVGPPRSAQGERSGSNAVIDGIAKATASVKVVNQSVLAAALAVAREKMGAAGPPRAAAVPRTTVEPSDFAGLERAGLVARLTLREADVEAAFAGTEAAGADPQARSDPNGIFADIRVAHLNLPMVGVNLLGEARWKHLMARLDGGQALLVSVGGRWRPFEEGYVHGATPDAVSLHQGGLALDLHDIVHEAGFAVADLPAAPWVVLKVFRGAGFDPAEPWTLSFRVVREKGQIFPVRIAKDFDVPVHLPQAWFERPAEEAPEVGGWRSMWVDRAGDLAVVLAAVGLLAGVLALQPRSMRRPRAVAAFRVGFLVFTLVGIGWVFQAQLSIVTLAGVVKAATTTGDLGFLLWDPPSLVLWGVVIVTAAVWGRGTFCGWLCPFGALQDLLARAAAPLRLPRLEVGAGLDRQLRAVKYVVLFGFLAVALGWPAQAEIAAEVEPFKTAITLTFQRAWPAVAYVGALLVANLFVHKAFCRWLCPLGAFVALLGRMRRFDWIARRSECGSPCRLCEKRCLYGAIERSGRIDYDECFQCMDCVVIHEDPQTCVPRVVAGRRRAATVHPRTSRREGVR